VQNVCFITVVVSFERVTDMSKTLSFLLQ